MSNRVNAKCVDSLSVGDAVYLAYHEPQGKNGYYVCSTELPRLSWHYDGRIRGELGIYNNVYGCAYGVGRICEILDERLDDGDYRMKVRVRRIEADSPAEEKACKECAAREEAEADYMA